VDEKLRANADTPRTGKDRSPSLKASDLRAHTHRHGRDERRRSESREHGGAAAAAGGRHAATGAVLRPLPQRTAAHTALPCVLRAHRAAAGAGSPSPTSTFGRTRGPAAWASQVPWDVLIAAGCERAGPHAIEGAAAACGAVPDGGCIQVRAASVTPVPLLPRRGVCATARACGLAFPLVSLALCRPVAHPGGPSLSPHGRDATAGVCRRPPHHTAKPPSATLCCSCSRSRLSVTYVAS